MNSKKNKKLVSIVLVNWNGKKWLKKCLKTLTNQTYKNIEIILIDNASTDGSKEYVRSNFAKIKIIENKKNIGFPRANNLGVKVSNGEYLLLINTDTWVKKDFIEKLLNFYNENSYSIISPLETNYNGKIEEYNIPTIDLTGSPAYFFPLSKQNKLFFMSACYFCLKKEFLETLGFDENYFAYYEDVDWFWRMSLLGKKFGYANDIYVFHAGAGSTGKGIKYKMFLYRNQNALQTILKNYSIFLLFIILPLYFLQNIVEILFFILILKFDIAYSYIQGWIFNIKNIKKIIKRRKWIQKRRRINDWEIIKKMYWGPAKLRMLINYSK